MFENIRFSKVVTVKAVQPFLNAESALEACQSISCGESTESLRAFLEQNLPKKKKKYTLGVLDSQLAKNLAQYDFPVIYDKTILELTRFCRYHMKRLMKQFGNADISKFQLGLGHSYSRSKISLDPNRQDKPVQNAVALIENLDKAINTFAMRIREWYSWHFPELNKIITDNIKFSRVAKLIGIKENFTEDKIDELTEIVGDPDIAQEIMKAKDTSIGQDIVSVDMLNIYRFSDELILMANQRSMLAEYLGTKLNCVAPNLQTLVGDVLAAKLIAHAGSLTNLAKYPASTIQILGAEKALFRALKTKSNTPKYGLLFQSGFIGRAAVKNKGRISRYLANKCSLATRIDNFASVPCSTFGIRMREQVESRLKYLSEGIPTKKNIDVMREANEEYREKVKDIEKKQRKAQKKLLKAATVAAENNPILTETETVKKKKRKNSDTLKEKKVTKKVKKN